MISLIGYTGFVGGNIYASSDNMIDGIYNSKKIENTDETYKEYVAGNISLGTFLKYAINQGAIDISSFELL